MTLTKSLSVLGAGFIFACSAIAARPPADPAPAPADTVHSYILLDRTGSMQGIWTEALASVNAYAQSVGEVGEDEMAGGDIQANVTLAMFDHHGGFQFDVLRDKQDAAGWVEVSTDEASPRGMTPLFDAIGRIVATAEADKPERAVIVIMTDGQENASQEMTRDGAMAALDRARSHGWEVVFLGAEFANFSDAEAVGMAPSQTMAVGQGRMQQSMDALAKQARSYGRGEQSAIIFDDAAREEAGEEEVKQRQNNQ